MLAQRDNLRRTVQIRLGFPCIGEIIVEGLQTVISRIWYPTVGDRGYLDSGRLMQISSNGVCSRSQSARQTQADVLWILVGVKGSL